MVGWDWAIDIISLMPLAERALSTPTNSLILPSCCSEDAKEQRIVSIMDKQEALSGGLRSTSSCRVGKNEIKRVLSSELIPSKKPFTICFWLSVDCKKHVSYYRQTVFDMAMDVRTGKLGWATHLG